jgi:hypothetical protein
MEAQKYYNVDITYLNEQPGKENILEGEQLIAFIKEEIEKYLDYIKQGKFGKQPLGNKKINVVNPESIKIFDFSKLHLSLDSTRPDFEKETRNKVKSTNDYLTAFEELGKEITDSFEINLGDLLGLTKTTATTQEGKFDEKKEQEKYGSKMSATISGKSNVSANLTRENYPIFPNEFTSGIIDKTVEPAFNVVRIAKVFANHIQNLNYEGGQMAGVFGLWGRGKSYFINEVFKILNNEKNTPFEIIKFQPWKFQNTPSIWAYLFETFIDNYLKVKWNEKLKRIFRLSVERKGKWYTWIWPLIGTFLGLIVFIIIPFGTKISLLLTLIKWIGGIGVTIIFTYEIVEFINISKKLSIRILNSISQVPSFKDVLGFQAEVQKELVLLIKTWKKQIQNKRILVFIDDLDRCSEIQLLNIIDSLRVMLDDNEINQNLLVLVALDENKLITAINKKYQKLTENEKNPNLANEYLDKLFISAIKLFPITNDERSEFVRKLASQINGDVPKEDNPDNQLDPTPIITPKPEAKNKKKSETSSEQAQTPKPTPRPTPEVEKSIKNLDDQEISLLDEKIGSTEKKLTPRQIRILIYRYLLARNLWIVFFKGLEFKSKDTIDEILRFSNLSTEDSNAETKINPGLSNIARMVVAY